jgi:glycosyltransferase involved in cell wall biosynthesis
MACSLLTRGVEVDVATTDDDGPGRHLSGTLASQPDCRNGYRVFHFHKQTEFYKASLPMAKWLLNHARLYDVAHVHALFSFSSLAAGMAARNAGLPYVMRPLGVLNQWGMKNRRRWLKNLSFRCLERPMLQRAAAIHYTSEQEKNEASVLGLSAPQVVIPLGIDLAPFDQLPAAELFHQAFPMTRDQQVVLFLSRLDQKKGVELLLEAFSRLRESRLKLVIAGGGEDTYVRKLHEKARDLSLQDRVVWTGPVSGNLKLAAFRAASLFVLPSSSENFGIALLEAMASGLPCISTKGVALAAESAGENAVRLSETNPEALERCMRDLLHDKQAAGLTGQIAAKLARQRYSLDAMGSALSALYDKIARP